MGDTQLDTREQKEDTKEDRKEERAEEESVRSPDRNISAKSPLRDRNANARSPNARSPHKDRSPLKPGVRSPLRDKHQGEKKPSDSEVVKSAHQDEICSKPEPNQVQNTPDAERSQGDRTPTKQDAIQPGHSPKTDRIQPEISPKQGEDEELSDGSATPLKRKAPELKTPDKKLKTSPKTTNMAAAEEETAAGEELGEEGEELGEAEDVPQMGVDALVCHEVDLDEPEEREKVSASEQLMLMREAHLLRAVPAKAPPPQATPEQNRGEPRDDTPRGHDHQGAPRGHDHQGAPRGGVRHEDNNCSPTSNGDRGQKRLLEGPHSPTVKKHKRPSHKRLTPHKPDKNGAGHSSDSEDQSRVSVKTHKHCPSPTSRGHKWTLHIDDLEKMSSTERISFLQEKLQEIRKYYLSLKSEVASIDRRRKRLKKKEREVSNTASASSSSDAAMSPSSSSPSQSSLAVEVR